MSDEAWNPELYQGAHAFVWERAADLVELLAPRPGERILDVGCGTGQLTAKLADSGAEVVGIDSSDSMIRAARANVPTVHFEVADIRRYRSSRPFDAVFSNAALHWVKPPEAAAESIALALRSGGRFVAEFGGRGNVSGILSAIHSAIRNAGSEFQNPWYFPSIAEYAALLEAYGLEATHAFHFPRFTPLEGGEMGLRNWLTMFGGPFRDLAGNAWESMMPDIEVQARPTLYRNEQWHADYHRIRIRAVRTESTNEGRIGTAAE